MVKCKRNSEPLADRIATIETWINKRKGAISRAKEDRADELLALERTAKEKQDARHSLTAKAAAMGRNIEEIEAKICELEVLLGEARNDQFHTLVARDSLMNEATRCSEDVGKAKKRWRVRLIKEFGDGKFRRKRRDLKKLQRRLARKEERAKSIPNMTAQEIQYGVLPQEKIDAEKVDNQS